MGDEYVVKIISGRIYVHRVVILHNLMNREENSHLQCTYILSYQKNTLVQPIRPS